MIENSTSGSLGKKIPLDGPVTIPTLNIGDSVTISSSTPFNWNSSPTWFTFYTKENGDVPLGITLIADETIVHREKADGQGRLSLNARLADKVWPPYDEMSPLRECFKEGEHAWFTLTNENDYYYLLTFPTGKTVKFYKRDNMTTPPTCVTYDWMDSYNGTSSGFSDVVIS